MQFLQEDVMSTKIPTLNLVVVGALSLASTIFLVTAVLGMFISNTATAVLMAPVAITIAKDLGFSRKTFTASA